MFVAGAPSAIDSPPQAEEKSNCCTAPLHYLLPENPTLMVIPKCMIVLSKSRQQVMTDIVVPDCLLISSQKYNNVLPV
jgi:hypothetical protein